VCLFVAALIFACPNVEISIYSTCERHPNMHIVCCVYARLCMHLSSGIGVRYFDARFCHRQAHQSETAAKLCEVSVHHPRRLENCSNGVHQAEQRRSRHSRPRVQIRQQEDKFVSFQGTWPGSVLKRPHCVRFLQLAPRNLLSTLQKFIFSSSVVSCAWALACD